MRIKSAAFRLVLKFLLWPALVIFALNVETLATKLGLNALLADNMGTAMYSAYEILQSSWVQLPAMMFIGSGIALWLDRILRSLEAADHLKVKSNTNTLAIPAVSVQVKDAEYDSKLRKIDAYHAKIEHEEKLQELKKIEDAVARARFPKSTKLIPRDIIFHHVHSHAKTLGNQNLQGILLRIGWTDNELRQRFKDNESFTKGTAEYDNFTDEDKTVWHSLNEKRQWLLWESELDLFVRMANDLSVLNRT
jgi:hypothetical protein